MNQQVFELHVFGAKIQLIFYFYTLVLFDFVGVK